MWTTNAALTDRHAYDSRPWTWPTLKRGIVCSISYSHLDPHSRPFWSPLELLGS
jgi:hypothetical protein